MTTPSATTSQKTPCIAAAKFGAWAEWIPPLAIVPATATPREAPTWRLVAGPAAATPASARGIPDTAVFVIGALIIPIPIPTIAYATISQARGVVTSRFTRSAPPVAVAIPAPTIARRARPAPTSRPDQGEQI